MNFNFKRTDTVRVRVTQAVVLAGGPQKVGTVVEVTGWAAMQMLSGANPRVELVEDFEPEPVKVRPAEKVVEHAEVAVETRDPVAKANSESAPPRKVKPKSRATRKSDNE